MGDTNGDYRNNVPAPKHSTGIRCHAAFAVHGACGALAAFGRNDDTTTRRNDVND